MFKQVLAHDDETKDSRFHENNGSWADEPFSCLKLEIFEHDVCRKQLIVRQGIWLVKKRILEKAGLATIKVHGLMNLFLV